MDTEIITDAMDPTRAAALAATLDVPLCDPLGPFWHQIYFWSPHVPGALGRDGHPEVGKGLMPDMGLPRRMWAGSRLQFFAPLRLGEPAKRSSKVIRKEHKTGRSGPLGIVTVLHQFCQEDQVVREEEQDIIYRADPAPHAPAPIPPVAPESAESERPQTFSPTLLFRYSALTFNGHRIHYDRPYATEMEGYAGLVVHGPLLAHLLMEMAQEELGALKAFRFRATSALMDFEACTLCRQGTALWVRGPNGRMCMEATAEV